MHFFKWKNRPTTDGEYWYTDPDLIEPEKIVVINGIAYLEDSEYTVNNLVMKNSGYFFGPLLPEPDCERDQSENK